MMKALRYLSVLFVLDGSADAFSVASRRTFGGLLTGALTPLVFRAPDAAHSEEMLSNSFLMADAIKTLDFSLPSYSDIKDPTASVETVKSLYVEAGKQAAPPKQGGDIGLLLPSMKKKSAEETKMKEAPPKKSSSSAKYEF